MGGDLRGLIDDGATIHHVDEPARHRGTGGTCDQPDRHHGGLAEAGRDVEGAGGIAGEHPLEERELPWEGGVDAERGRESGSRVGRG